MTSNTQTSNMFAKLNAFVEAFMGRTGNMGYCRWDEIMSEWRDLKNQQELETIFKTVKKRKKRKKKDSNAPKRGRSAYIYFCSKNRADAKKKSGDGATLGQVGKELGLMWQEAKLNNDIDEYKKLADTDKIRYNSEMEDYVPPSDDELEEQQRKSKKRKKRKRGLSSYMCFCKAERPTIKSEHPDLAPKEVMVELGRRWSEAKKGDISKWKKQAAESKAAAAASTDDDEKPKKKKKKVSEDEEAELIEEDEEAKSPAPKKKKKKKKKKVSEDEEAELIEEDEEAKSPAPKKKSGKRIYAYAFFVKNQRTKIGNDTSLNGKELTKELSKLWKALSKEEKAEWKALAVAVAVAESA